MNVAAFFLTATVLMGQGVLAVGNLSFITTRLGWR
jgi:hypothetical protein